MKRYAAILVSGFFLLCTQLRAQTVVETGDKPDNPVHKVFTEMPASISIDQPKDVEQQFAKHVGVMSGRSPQASSFCIRIYSNSGRSAREESSHVLSRFSVLFPEIEATRTYNSPYFMVSAGTFSSRMEAEEALKTIKDAFPRAYIIRR